MTDYPRYTLRHRLFANPLLALLVTAALGLVPLWTVHYLPQPDLGVHLVAAQYHSGLEPHGRFGFFRAEWIFSPYILFYLVIAPLVKWVGPIAAAKIVLSIYIVSLPAAFWWFLQRSGSCPAYAFLLLPMVFSYHFEWGFIQYCLGVPITFAALVCCFRVLAGRLTASWGALAAILVVAAYLSHIDNFIALSLGVAVRSSGILFSNRDRFRWVLLKQVTRMLILFCPVIVLMLEYWTGLRRNPDFHGATISMFKYRSLYDQVTGLIQPFFSIEFPLEAAWLVLVVFFVGFGIVSGRIRVGGQPGLVLAFAYAFIVLLIPRDSFLGSWDHNSRFVVYATLSAFAALQPIKPTPRSWVIVPGILFYLAFVGVRIPHYRDVDVRTNDIVLTLNRTVPPGSRVYNLYPVVPFFKYGAVSLKPGVIRRRAEILWVASAIAYYHLENGGVSPFLFSDQPHVNGLFEIEPLPRYVDVFGEGAVNVDTFSGVLAHYDYLLITTLGGPLPPWLTRLPIKEIQSSANCSVYVVTKRPGKS